jgi:hypothetical protein
MSWSAPSAVLRKAMHHLAKVDATVNLACTSSAFREFRISATFGVRWMREKTVVASAETKQSSRGRGTTTLYRHRLAPRGAKSLL